MYCNQCFSIDEVGFQALEQSLWVRYFILKKRVVRPVSSLSG
jgi:hypothetical protein